MVRKFSSFRWEFSKHELLTVNAMSRAVIGTEKYKTLYSTEKNQTTTEQEMNTKKCTMWRQGEWITLETP